jgi:pSer/pThr/pTyr-binding forkhead associated (FHA) protein
MAELLIHSGKLQGRKLTLPEGEIVLGRDESCQLRLNSNDISRQHCALTCTVAGLRVRDMGSANGTYVNDVAIEGEVLLHPGDLLRVGPMIFQVPHPKEGSPAASHSAAIETATQHAAAVRPVPAPHALTETKSKGNDAPQPLAAASIAQKVLKGAATKPVKKATDDDIATWLTDDDSSDQIKTSDTTIVTAKALQSAVETAPVANPAAMRVDSGAAGVVRKEGHAANDLKDKKAFRTVSEEAADIIRRHHEKKKRNS